MWPRWDGLGEVVLPFLFLVNPLHLALTDETKEPIFQWVLLTFYVCSAKVRCALRTALTFFILFFTEGFVK